MKHMAFVASRLVVGGLLCVASSTTAGEALPEPIQACKREADDARRLACYDREIAGWQSATATAARPWPGVAAPVQTLTARVVSLREQPRAGFVVTLDNGEVWAQSAAEGIRGVKSGDNVTIKPGALGSYWLVGPTGIATKAHRLQ